MRVPAGPASSQLQQLLPKPPASHTRPPRLWPLAQVLLKDGTAVEAYEHGMTLGIVALRGSVPTQWVLDFRQGLGR